MDTKLIVSASPHVRSDETTQSLMANVIVALCPCVVASAIIFGVRALLVTAVSVVACVVFEWLYCIRKHPSPAILMTCFSGHPICAPIAAPRPYPIVPRPPDVRSVLGFLYL